jgi:aldehyde dehydrogenase (NAD+)
MREFTLFIGGEFVDSAGGETCESHNPSTGEAVARVAKGTPQDMERAIGAARDAFDRGPWPRMTPADRASVMGRAFEIMQRRQDELAQLEAEDAGHTMRMASLFTVPYAIEFWRHLTELGARFDYEEPVEPYHFPSPTWHFVLREPFGVCAGITPWNFPFLMVTWKLAPALITGNTIVLKPAMETPLTALAMAEIIEEAGFPPGVVNIVPGPGPSAGEALVTDPRVDKVSFTGSTEVGRRIMQLASGTLKKVTLELGGKSPNILLDDADLDIALPGSLWATLMHQGQACESGTRMFVPSSMYDEVTARLVELAEGLTVGSAMDFSSDLGPILNRTQFDVVERYVQIGQDEGAKLLTGGHRVTDGLPEGGHYYAPTIFGDVDNGMKIAQEEIFGPVLAVIRYDGVDEAITMANDSIYGLAGGVWSRDIPRALSVARRLRTGTVWVNDWHLLSPAAPHGGYKQSGVGREFGPWGISEHLQVKYVRVDQVQTSEQKFWFRVIGL